MYLHKKLVDLKFEVDSIVDIKDLDKGCIYYKRTFNHDINIMLAVRLNGEVTLNEFIPNESRNLIFKICYFSDDDLIIEYLKKYIKDTEKELLDK
jgi:hypothetical protein